MGNIKIGNLTRENEDFFELPKEVSQEISLPENRDIFINIPYEKIGVGGNYSYDLILKENSKVIGRYNAQDVTYSENNRNLNVIYSLFSAKPQTKVPNQLLNTFSSLQKYISSNNDLKINHFAPIITSSKKKIPGLIRILNELGYEHEHPKEPFYGKTYWPSQN
jgi:hypothetical protein